MTKIVKSLLLILLTIPAFLDIVSCKDKYSCKKQSYEIYVYSYNGEFFEKEFVQTEVYRNTKLDLSEFDDISLEGYTFLGWCEFYNKLDIKSLEDLLNNKNQMISYLNEKINRSIFHNSYYYPLFVKNDELVNFLETEEIAKVKVTLYKVIVENTQTVKITGTLFDTYNETLKFDLDVDNCTLLGCTTQHYSYDYFKQNKDKITLLDMETQIKFTNELVVYAYYE